MNTPQEHIDKRKTQLKNAGPYRAPEGYFEEFGEKLQHKIELQELQEIAPVLFSIQFREPYSAPSGYFDHLPHTLVQGIQKEKRTFLQVFFKSRLALSAASVAALLILLFTILPPSGSNSEVLLADVPQEELDDYVNNELSSEMNAQEIGELLAIENHNITGAPVETLSEYIVEEVTLNEIIEEF